MAAAKEEAEALKKGKEEAERTLADYKSSSGDSSAAAEKELETLKKSLAEAAEKAAELAKGKAAAEDKAAGVRNILGLF